MDISGFFRLIIAFCIVVFHTKSFYVNNIFELLRIPFIFNGSLDNQFFFTLSGYYITEKYAKNIASGKTKGFLKKHYIKFVMLSVITLPAAIVFQHLYYGVTGWGKEPTPLGVVTDALLITSGYGITDGNPYNQPLWFLDVLFLIYVIFYVIQRKSGKYLKAVYLIIIILCTSIMHNGGTVWHFDGRLFSGLFAFLCGSAWNLYIEKNENAKQKIRLIFASVIIVVLFWIYAFSVRGGVNDLYSGGDQMLLLQVFLWMPVLMISTGIIVKSDGIIGKMSKLAMRLSTSIYIWHYPLIYFSSLMLYTFFKMPSQRSMYFILSMVHLCVVALVSCFIIEPFMMKMISIKENRVIK